MGALGNVIFAMEDAKANKEEVKRQKLKHKEFLYQKAIEAYQFHVNRYHTWMNYYSLFDGALLVAYCTLLCATNLIVGGKGGVIKDDLTLHGSIVYLQNNYNSLILLMSILGVLTSVLWLLCIKGHRLWTISWIHLIYKYEKEFSNDLLYGSFVIDKKFKTETYSQLLEKGVCPSSYSTDKLTMIFVHSIIFAWILALLYVLGVLHSLSCVICFLSIYLFLILILSALARSCPCILLLFKWLYSELSDLKYIYSDDI